MIYRSIFLSSLAPVTVSEKNSDFLSKSPVAKTLVVLISI